MVGSLMDNKIPKWYLCKRVNDENKLGYNELEGSLGNASGDNLISHWKFSPITQREWN